MAVVRRLEYLIRQKMGDRLNTIVCIFDLRSPRITAYQIHDWIYERIRLPEKDVRMLQIDGPGRRVYIKFTTSEQMYAVLQKNCGTSLLPS